MIRRDLGMPPLPPLGKVAQKKMQDRTLEQHWKHGIHQNIVWIGHGRPSYHSLIKARSRRRRSERRGS